MKQSDKSASMPGTPDKAGSAGKAKFIGAPRYIGKADPAKAKSENRPDTGRSSRPGRPSGDRPSFGGRPSGDRPSFGGRPSGDRPHPSGRPGFAGRTNRPSGDRPSFGSRPSGDRPSGDRPSFGGRPSGDRPSFSGRPSGDRPSFGGRPSGDRPSFDGRPSGDRPHSSSRPGYAGRPDRPSGDRPHTSSRPGYAGRTDRPSGDRPNYGDRPSGDRPGFGDRPNGDRPHFSSRPGYAGRPDRPSGDRPHSSSRPGYTGRTDRPSGDRPSFGDRSGSDRPSFGGRPSGDRPNYGDRSGSDRPHPSSRPGYAGRTDRPNGNRPSYGDRPSGDRPSYAGKAKRFEKPNASGHPSFVGKFKVSGKPEFVENSAQAALTEKPANLDLIMPAVSMIGLEQSIQKDIAVDEASAGSPDRLEGRNPILEALKAGRTINKIWVAKREEKPDPNLGRLITQAREAGAVIMEVDRRVLDQMSETHGHQGVIAQVAAHEYVELTELVTAIRERQETPFLLILSEIQESYNLGSILRIADAAGVHGVIIPQRRAVGLDAAVAKASAGAIEHVPVCRVTNLSQTIESLKEQGFWIAGTDSEGTVSYEKADWQGPLAILIGGEGEGISPVLRQHCDFLISIPMQGHVNSLNAAVAAGVVVFEAARQRREKNSEQV